MRIVRQNEQELVVRDSMIWLSVFFALVSLPMIYAALAHGTKGIQYPAGVFLLIALFCLRKKTFVFDARQRIVRWHGIRVLRTYSGSMPFSEITEIGTETMPSPHGQTLYRLTLITARGSTPISDGYGGGGQWFEKIREAIVAFVKPDAPSVAGAASTAGDSGLDASIRSLLAQGRKIDAIALARTRENLDLTQAVQRVKEVEEQRKAK
ncbi:MAG: hypothetical protein ABSC48_09390 [Terracidiphilus sp.]|jgi:hypothetical protein